MIVLGVILLYFITNISFLEAFPFVHSDESWLGGLSRNIMDMGDIGTTESFFDLKVRYPHAIKTLFHLLQIVMIQCFGYRLFSLRLLSLIVSGCCLAIFWRAGLRLFKKPSLSFLSMILLSVDIQFIYAAHFARSEIMICLALCLCLLFLLRENLDQKAAVILALITGVSIFIHPNSFFLACLCICVLLYRCRNNFRPLLIYIGVTALFALSAVWISQRLDPDFIHNYFTYGQREFDVLAPAGDKISEIGGFFSRIWNQFSGTYYVPDIRVQMVLFPFVAAVCAVFALVMRKEFPVQSEQILSLILASVGILAGITAVGRFNQTSVLFFFPIGWLLTVKFCEILSERWAPLISTVFSIGILILSVLNIAPWTKCGSYDRYLSEIANYVPANARTLANLNTEFYFEENALRDYRNLPFAFEGEGIPAYIHDDGIEYILYSDELDFIFENRPYYNAIYGNPMFVESLREFLKTDCVLVGSFHNPVYGVRIRALMNDPEYGTVTVYRVVH